jgi:putative CocE/NonD family hydrolase
MCAVLALLGGCAARQPSPQAAPAPTVPVAAPAPTPAGPDVSWGAGDPAYAMRPAEYSGSARKGYYVTMRDGVKIAVDVWLPTGLAQGTRLPAILEQTRYFRSAHVKKDPNGPCRPPAKPTIDLFVTHGYAYVLVDVRGSGASFGSRNTEYSDEEVKDGGEIVDWIAKQDWSDGKVGALGQSYTGTSAEMLLRNHRPAVKAALPTFSGYDFYSEILMPGGIKSTFGQWWGNLVGGLDRNIPEASSNISSVCPVDDDVDQSQLRGAIAAHAQNLSVVEFVDHIAYRDDRFAGQPGDASSAFRYQREIDAGKASLYAIVGWYDSGYQISAIRRFLTTAHQGRQHVLIGPWNHGAHYYNAPGVRQATPSAFNLAEEKLRYFDFQLKGIDEGLSSAPPIRYWTTGVNRWQGTDRWPPAGSHAVTWYLSDDASLAAQAPRAKGADAHAFDGTADAGENNRWHADIGILPVFYPDRAAADAKLLTYTSAPLAADLQVTGDPVAHVYLSVDGTDADVIVYLEEVTASGEVNYLTEGVLRASHRRLGKLAFKTPGPVHSDRRADALAVVPGKRMRLDVGLLPLSHVFSAGSRIRVALSNADRAQFQEHPVQAAQWTVFRDAAHASRIELPVISSAADRPSPRR